MTSVTGFSATSTDAHTMVVLNGSSTIILENFQGTLAGGADRLGLGDGRDVVRGTLAKVDGDTIVGVGNGDHMRVSDVAKVVSQTRDDAGNTVVVLSDGDDVTARLIFAGGLPKNLSLQGNGRLIFSGILEFDDVIPGTNRSDTISALGGDDLVFGYGGDDHLYGGDGNDILVGGGGRNDRLYGGKDDDRLIDHGSSTMRGNAGNDTLYTSGDRHSWFRAELYGDSGNDKIKGGSDTLYGGTGNDTLKAGSGRADRVYGEEGDDYLTSHGSGSMWGGVGNDTLDASGGRHLKFRVALHGGSGDDRMKGCVGGDTLNGGIGDDTIRDGRGSDRFVFEA